MARLWCEMCDDVSDRDIRQGDEVSDSYGLSFIETPLRLRQKRLSEQYKFQCQCRACQEDFSLFVNSDKVKSR